MSDNPNGSWSDRYLNVEELASKVEAIGCDYRSNVLRDAVSAMRGQLGPPSFIQQIADELAELAGRIGRGREHNEIANVFADASDCLDELAREREADLNLPYFRRIDCGPFEPAELRELPDETDDDGLPL